MNDLKISIARSVLDRISQVPSSDLGTTKARTNALLSTLTSMHCFPSYWRKVEKFIQMEPDKQHIAGVVSMMWKESGCMGVGVSGAYMGPLNFSSQYGDKDLSIINYEKSYAPITPISLIKGGNTESGMAQHVVNYSKFLWETTGRSHYTVCHLRNLGPVYWTLVKDAFTKANMASALALPISGIRIINFGRIWAGDKNREIALSNGYKARYSMFPFAENTKMLKNDWSMEGDDLVLGRGLFLPAANEPTRYYATIEALPWKQLPYWKNAKITKEIFPDKEGILVPNFTPKIEIVSDYGIIKLNRNYSSSAEVTNSRVLIRTADPSGNLNKCMNAAARLAGYSCFPSLAAVAAEAKKCSMTTSNYLLTNDVYVNL